MTRGSAGIAMIGVALGCLWLAATSAAKEFPVRSTVASPIPPSAHPRLASPDHVALPLRPFDPAVLKAARDRAHTPSLNPHQPSTVRTPQTPLGSKASVFGGLSWAGLAAAPASSTRFTPPDGGAGIGPNAFIEAINSEMAVYNRSTTALIGSLSLAMFFHGATEPCDPYVLWDNGAQRWVVTSIECATTSSHTIYLAFTKSTDPTDLAAGWCTYSIDTGSEFADFPKTGHNNSDWLVGTNDFSTSTQDFDTAQLWAFEKPANGTITTCPLIPIDSTSTVAPLAAVDGAEIFTPDASDQLDSGAPPSGTASDTGYFVAYESPQTAGAVVDEINVIDFNRDASGRAHFTPEGDIPVTPFDFPFAVAQPGALPGDDLDPSDMRGLGATSHVDPTRCSNCEAVWLAHAIDGPGSRSQIQWDEVDPAGCTGRALCGSAALLQDGLLSSPSLSYWNPRISPDGFGNEAVMNFDAGGATQLPEIMAVSNTPADAPGATGAPILIKTSSHPDDDFSCPSAATISGPVCRWGDYAAAEADPLNPGVVWNNSMYTAGAVDAGRDAQWGTQNFAVRAAGPATNVTVSLTPPSVPANGTAQTVAKATIADADGNPVQGEAVSFDSSDGGDHIGPVTDNHDGTYTATITSSTRVGTPIITAKDSSVATSSVFGQATLTQTLGPATTVAVRLSPSSIVADGTSQSTATATITDALGRPIAGDQVSFSSSDGGNHIGAATDNHDGTYTATITSSTTAGTPTVTATDSSVTPPLSGDATLTQAAAKPVITNLTESHHRFRVGKALATLASSGPPSRGHDALARSSVLELAKLLFDEVVALAGSPGQPSVASAAKPPPVGTVFSFTLNTTAQVQLAFAQTLPGRKVRGKCLAQNDRNHTQAKCRHTVSRGSISLSAHPGTNLVSFAGLVSPTKKLSPAHYTMTLTATNSTGQSAPKTISFTVVK